MLFEMQHLPPEFIVYVENYWQEYRQLSKLIAKNNHASLYFKLDNLLNYHIENNSIVDLDENLNDLIYKCSQLLKKVTDTEKYVSQLETLESKYHAFVESYGVDFNDRTYDEEFYAFIHGINNN